MFKYFFLFLVIAIAIVATLFFFEGFTGAPIKTFNHKQTAKNKQVIIGRIDENFLIQVQQRPTEVNSLTVVSFGGKTSYGIKIAREVFNNKLELSIAEVCLSACAEYLLPAAKNIHLIDQPLIGYHRNPIILKHLLTLHANKDLEHCTNIGDDDLLQLLIDTDKKTNAWKHTLSKMNLTYYEVDYKKDACPWSSKTFENKFWFPTTGQLEVIFGLEVSGKLCADNPECYKKKIPHYFREGGSFIVGDEKIIVPSKP